MAPHSSFKYTDVRLIADPMAFTQCDDKEEDDHDEFGHLNGTERAIAMFMRHRKQRKDDDDLLEN